jgi:hypothetical protein
MSIFASYITRTVPLPFDEPHTVTIQKLSRNAIDEAEKVRDRARQAAAAEYVKAIGGPAFARELVTAQASVARPTDEGAVARRQATGRRCSRGVKAWTYDDQRHQDRLGGLDQRASDLLSRHPQLTLPNGDAKRAAPNPHRALDGVTRAAIKWIVGRRI